MQSKFWDSDPSLLWRRAHHQSGKLKEMRAFTGQVILGFPKEAGRLAPQELLKTRVDRILETPFDTELLIRSICELLSLDADSHVDKLNKFTMYTPGPENQAVRNGEAAPPVASVVKITSRLTSAEREARFQKYVSQRSVQTADGGLDRKISDTTFKRSEVRDKWAEVKKDWDPQKLADQDALKKNFARALFEDEGEGDKD